MSSLSTCYVRNLARAFLLCLVCLTGSISLSQAQGDSLSLPTPLVLDSLEKTYDLDNEYVQIWKTPDRNLSPEEVWEKAQFGGVETLKEGSLKDLDIWVSFTIKSGLNTPAKWVLYDLGGTEYMDLYWEDEAGWQHLKTGSHIPRGDRAVPRYQYRGLNIDLDSIQEHQYLLRLRNTFSKDLIFALEIMSRKRWDNASEERNLVYIFAFVAILGIMFLYSFMVYLGTREPTYLHYALYIASITGFVMFANGPHTILVYPKMNIYMMFISLSGISIFYFMFGRSFLDTPQLIPKWDKWIRYYIRFRIALLLIQLGLLYFWREEDMVIFVEFSFFLVDAVLSVLLYIVLIKTGSILARYFIVGSSLVFVFSLSYLAINIVLLEQSPDFDLFFMAIIAEILVFALGLGYKMRKSEKDKLAAQAEKLEAQQALNQELSKVNTAFGRFVPHEFLQSLGYDSILDIQLGDAVEREVTVFFSDIRDYTSLSEEMSPKENFHFLNAYLGRVGPVIKKHGGFVNQYYGDGIMAIFMDSPADALQAAIEMRSTIRDYNQFRAEKGRRPIRVGIGLHTGPLMMGVIGDTLRMEAGVVSDTVNTAARMEGLTKHFQANIMVSESTVKGAGEFEAQHRFLGRVKVKGRKEPLSVFEYYEGDEPALLSLKQKTQEDFEKGLRYFYEKNFVESAKAFDQVLAVFPKDQPARQYHERATQLIIEGIPEGWTGVDIVGKK